MNLDLCPDCGEYIGEGCVCYPLTTIPPAKIYGIEAGRCITLNGLPVATLHAVSGPNGLYNIGGPTEMDEFAREVVESLKWWESTKDEANDDLHT